jgi:uncharacterized protein YbjQ (UPF0145 family)
MTIKIAAWAALFAAGLLSAAAPSAVAATPAEKIMLTDMDIAWQYEEIGPVGAVVHQTALLTKRPMMQQLDDALREEAAKLGADAVIRITYAPGSPFGKKGFRAEGTAVRFRQQPDQFYAAAPPAAPQSAAPAAPASPPSPTLAAPAPPANAVAAAPSPRMPTPEAMILLSDQDITYRPYTVLGEISATVHQTSLFRKIPIRVDLDRALRAEAAKLGADAVVMIEYEDGSPLDKKGFRGAGKAIRFN